MTDEWVNRPAHGPVPMGRSLPAETLRRAVPLLAAALAGALCVGLAVAAPDLSRQILEQKAKLLEQYLSSGSIARIEADGAPEAKAELNRARAVFDAASRDLAQGLLERAATGFDEALRRISLVVAAAKKRPKPSGAELKARYSKLRGQIDSYLAALERDPGTGETQQSLAEDRATLRGMIDAAEGHAAAGRLDLASGQLSEAYRHAVASIAARRKGETTISRLSFTTRADEFAYEVRRNDSYRLLVDIMLGERDASSPGFKSLVEREVRAHESLRQVADLAAAQGDYVAAMASLEGATRHLIRALRAGGLPVFE